MVAFGKKDPSPSWEVQATIIPGRISTPGKITVVFLDPIKVHIFKEFAKHLERRVVVPAWSEYVTRLRSIIVPVVSDDLWATLVLSLERSSLREHFQDSLLSCVEIDFLDEFNKWWAQALGSNISRMFKTKPLREMPCRWSFKRLTIDVEVQLERAVIRLDEDHEFEIPEATLIQFSHTIWRVQPLELRVRLG